MVTPLGYWESPVFCLLLASAFSGSRFSLILAGVGVYMCFVLICRDECAVEMLLLLSSYSKAFLLAHHVKCMA